MAPSHVAQEAVKAGRARGGILDDALDRLAFLDRGEDRGLGPTSGMEDHAMAKGGVVATLDGLATHATGGIGHRPSPFCRESSRTARGTGHTSPDATNPGPGVARVHSVREDVPPGNVREGNENRGVSQLPGSLDVAVVDDAGLEPATPGM